MNDKTLLCLLIFGITTDNGQIVINKLWINNGRTESLALLELTSLKIVRRSVGSSRAMV